MRLSFLVPCLAIATALTLVTIDDAFGQRGGRGGGRGGGYGGGGSGFSAGPGGFSYGSGRSGFSVGPGGFSYGQGYGNYGRGYGYGNSGYGYYGNNPGWNRGYYGGYGGNYNSGSGYYVQPSYQPSYQAAAPYQGPGVAVRNMSDVALNFTVDDFRTMKIEPGETHRLTQKGQFVVTFDRGEGEGQARYTIREGLYEFTPTDHGWELYRQKADTSLPARAGGEPNAEPRTEVLRPRIDEDADARETDRPRLNDSPRGDDEAAPARRDDAAPADDADAPSDRDEPAPRAKAPLDDEAVPPPPDDE